MMMIIIIVVVVVNEMQNAWFFVEIDNLYDVVPCTTVIGPYKRPLLLLCA